MLDPVEMHCCLYTEHIDISAVKMMHMQAVGKDGTSPHVRACRADVYFVMGAHENAAEVRASVSQLLT